MINWCLLFWPWKIHFPELNAWTCELCGWLCRMKNTRPVWHLHFYIHSSVIFFRKTNERDPFNLKVKYYQVPVWGFHASDICMEWVWPWLSWVEIFEQVGGSLFRTLEFQLFGCLVFFTHMWLTQNLYYFNKAKMCFISLTLVGAVA